MNLRPLPRIHPVRLSSATWGIFAAIALVSAIACSSPPEAEFEASSDGGPVPLEVTFAPVEESDDTSFFWEFGDGMTSDERVPTHVFQDAGDLVVRLTATKGGSEAVSTRTVSLEPGEPGWITVEPSSIELLSGERVQIVPSAFDSLGNPITDAEFTWSASETAGEVLPDGTFIAGPNVDVYDRAITVEFERLGGKASLNLPVSIQYGGLDSVVLEPASINLRVNNRLDLNVIARDAQGHVLPEPDIELTAIRSVVDSILPGGEFVAGTLPTQSEQPLVLVEVTVGDETVTETIRGTITEGILDRIDVTASSEEIAVGDEVTFDVRAFDRFGNLLSLDSLDWELVDGSYGEIDADGRFVPAGAAVSAAGPLITAIGELDRVLSYAEIDLDVQPGPATAIVINPAVDSVVVGAGNPFGALVVDEFGNVIEDANVIWSAADGGAIDATGIFVAGFETGDFPGAVTATLPAGASGNPEAISASADLAIRDRSSDMLAVEVSSATDTGIIIIDLVTSAIRSLADELDTNDGIEISPAWWPDGQRVAFASDVTGTLQIYDVDIDTGTIRQLVDVPAGSSMPAISPDGSKIAFVVPDGEWHAYVADLPEPDENGDISPIMLDQATRLSDDESVQNLLPVWSPDGTMILFTTSTTIRDVELFVVPADGSEAPRRISEAAYSGFAWSSGGEFVLVVDNLSGGAQNLLVVDVASGEVEGFVPLPFEAFTTAWSPDNLEVAVVDRITGALWLLDSDGSSLRQAVASDFVPRNPAWRPVPIDAEAVLASLEEPAAA